MSRNFYDIAMNDLIERASKLFLSGMAKNADLRADAETVLARLGDKLAPTAGETIADRVKAVRALAETKDEAFMAEMIEGVRFKQAWGWNADRIVSMLTEAHLIKIMQQTSEAMRLFEAA